METVEILLEAGADVNAQNQIAKMTPLHCAVQGAFNSATETHARRIRCVELLLAAGADRKLPTKRGEDAFALAEASLREAGDSDAVNDAREMRVALKGADATPLRQAIEDADRGAVARCLGGPAGVAAAEATDGLRAAADRFAALLDEGDADRDAYEALTGIM